MVIQHFKCPYCEKAMDEHGACCGESGHAVRQLCTHTGGLVCARCLTEAQHLMDDQRMRGVSPADYIGYGRRAYRPLRD